MWSSGRLAGSSNNARNGPPKSESQHKNNMKQKTVLHVHVNNYTAGSSHKPPRPNNPRSSGYQGQSQTKATASSGNPQYSRQAHNLQKTNHQGAKNWQTNQGQGSNKQLGQSQKQYNTNTNQRTQNSNSKNQDYKQNKQTHGNGSNTAKKVIVVKTTKIINTKTIIKK